MSKWISVKERIPEQLKPILVVVNGVVQNVTYEYDSDSYVDGYALYQIHFFDEEGEFYIPAEKVTHWMPLPEPPEAL